MDWGRRERIRRVSTEGTWQGYARVKGHTGAGFFAGGERAHCRELLRSAWLRSHSPGNQGHLEDT
eukprot:6150452-Alexandrium_andersonii.AAC.1